MESPDDPKLSELLKAWQVPGAPPSLDAHVLASRAKSRPWTWRTLAKCSAIAAVVATVSIVIEHQLENKWAAMVVALLTFPATLLATKPIMLPQVPWREWGRTMISGWRFRPVEPWLRERTVKSYDPADEVEGYGFKVTLSCGHSVFCMTEPPKGTKLLCWTCIDKELKAQLEREMK